VTDEQVHDLALGVLATLDAATAELLYAFATGLKLAGSPADDFWLPVFYLAEDREQEVEPGTLTVRLVRVSFPRVDRQHRLGVVRRQAPRRERVLAGKDPPPWVLGFVLLWPYFLPFYWPARGKAPLRFAPES
jgi:hypothetical protein